MNLPKIQLCIVENDTDKKNPALQRVIIPMAESFEEVEKDEGFGNLNGGAAAGALSRIGMLQAIELGKYLKQHYHERLFHGHSPDALTWKMLSNHMMLRSTFTERTIETLQGVVKGMFDGDQTLESFNAVIVDKKDKKKHEWAVYNAASACPKLTRYFHTGLELATGNMSEPGKKLLEELSKIKMELSEHVGLWKIHVYRDHIFCRYTHGLELPEGVKHIENYMQRIHDESTAHIQKLFASTDETDSLRLGIGRMLCRILDSAKGSGDSFVALDQTKRNKESEMKMFLYSAHDWTLTPLLQVFRPDVVHEWPPFASNIVLEVYEDRDPNIPVSFTHGNESFPRYVRILYRGVLVPIDVIKVCEEFEISIDEEAIKLGLIPLEALEKYLEPYISKDEDMEKDCFIPMRQPSRSVQKHH